MEFIKNKNIVVLDIETTGIKANTDKIIELYMLKVYNNEVVEEYDIVEAPIETIGILVLKINFTRICSQITNEFCCFYVQNLRNMS